MDSNAASEEAAPSNFFLNERMCLSVVFVEDDAPLSVYRRRESGY